jgi:hypothetical protein
MTFTFNLQPARAAGGTITDWPMFRYDPAHTGYSTSTAPTTSAIKIWNYKTGRDVYSSPAVAGGYVYIGSWDDNVYAFGTPPAPVGGVMIPVDKLALLAPYIGLASTILVAAAVAVVYVKRVKLGKEKR